MAKRDLEQRRPWRRELVQQELERQELERLELEAAVDGTDGTNGTAGGSVAYECAAFLRGTLAEYWEEREMPVPVWAWTNLLAHGTEELIAESIGRPSRRRAARSWKLARSYLAYEVFDLVDDEFTLPLMQSTILVPLELSLSGRPEVNRWTLKQWVDTVDLAIRNQPLIVDL